MEKRPIGVHTGYGGHSFMKRYEALGRGDAFENSAGRTHGLMAANKKRTSAAIRVLNEKDCEARPGVRIRANVVDKTRRKRARSYSESDEPDHGKRTARRAGRSG